MHYRGRLNSILAALSIIIFVFTVAVVPATFALPSTAGGVGLEIRGMETRATIDNNVDATPPSRLRRLFSEWIGGNRARIVAETTKPHIKRWTGRRKYRGVHH